MTSFEGRLRGASLPSATAEQIRALDAVHVMAAKNAIKLPLKQGDMVFINDQAVLHARESFTEEESTDHKRHLLKLYLRDPQQNRPVPSSLAKHFDKMYGPGRADGKREEYWPIAWSPELENTGMMNG
jgi:hypothetical protein